MQIKKVGVIGCGLMGSGIAQVCAQSGYDTTVSEINDELLNKGLGSIKNILTKNVEKGRLRICRVQFSFIYLLSCLRGGVLSYEVRLHQIFRSKTSFGPALAPH